MVTRAAAGEDIIGEVFLDEVTWFAIYSCILGAVMMTGTYVSIMLFNFAAHSQVSHKITQDRLLKL